jgi:hypothetical protein
MFVFGLASWLMPGHVICGYLLDNSDQMHAGMMQVNKVRVIHHNYSSSVLTTVIHVQTQGRRS